MKRYRFAEEQIISILKEHHAGTPPVGLALRPGFADGALYHWKSKFGGMEVPKAKRLMEPGAENGRLKGMLVDELLDKAALKDALSRKW